MDNVKSIYAVFQGFLNDAMEMLPELAMATVVMILFVIASRIAKRVVHNLSSRVVDDRSLQSLFGTLTSTAFIVIGAFVAAAVLFPGLEAGDLIAVLGLSSVAIGFAFKDIFENFLAGILILSRRPFRIGDQIHTGDFDGTVKDISFRNTEMETYDGEIVILPNSMLFKDPVIVHTANSKRRSHFSAGIAYDADIREAKEAMMRAVKSCEHVADEPEPVIWCTEHGANSVNFDVVYWTKSDIRSVRDAGDEVATAIKYALDDAGIGIPFPQRVLHLAPEFVDDEGRFGIDVRGTGSSNSKTTGTSPGSNGRSSGLDLPKPPRRTESRGAAD